MVVGHQESEVCSTMPCDKYQMLREILGTCVMLHLKFMQLPCEILVFFREELLPFVLMTVFSPFSFFFLFFL